MSGSIKAVDNLNEGTTGPSAADVRKQIAALMAQANELRKTVPDFDAQEKARIEEIRFQAWKVRHEMEPLEIENQRLIAEHLALAGLSKIRFSEDESAAFLNRYQASNKAAKK